MRQVKKGSTNVSVELYIVDDADGKPELGVLWNTAGIDLNYRRDGEVVTSITEADLTTPDLTDAHEDGGFLEVANGRYRLDVPDAAFATGVSQVTIGGTITGMVVLPETIQLVDFDPDDATRMGMTALPGADADAAGGLPISDGGGLDMDAKLANTNEITVARMGALTDWINGGRLDLLLDAVKAVTDLLPNAGALNDLATAANLATVDAVVDGIQADLSNGVDGLGALKTLIDAVPTTSEFNSRTLIAASYATAVSLATAQADLDIITGVDGATLATLQPLYAPNKIVPDAAGMALFLISSLNDVSPADLATALTDIHLDRLLAVDYDPANKPGVATALFNELIESNAGVSRFTAAALFQAPSGTGGDATAANQLTIIKYHRAQHIVDKEKSPYELVKLEDGTGPIGFGTELQRQKLKDIDGLGITRLDVVIGGVTDL